MPPDRTTEQFIDYIKGVEGFRAEPYLDPGNGKPTIYWGHTILPGEDFSNVEDPEAEGNRVLFEDMLKARDAAKRAAPLLREGLEFGEMPRMDQYKYLDFAMNEGQDFYKEKRRDKKAGHPLWATAVAHGDVEAELEQYHRYSNGELMDVRNRKYLEFFHGDEAESASTSTDERQGGEPEVDGGQIEGIEGAGAAPPSPLNALFADPEFLKKSPADQVTDMREVSPDFAQLYELDKQRALDFASNVRDKIDEQDPDFMESLGGGFQYGGATLLHTLANAAMLLEDIGWENDLDDSWRKKSGLMFLDAERHIGSDWYDQVAMILGSLPGGLAIPGLATAAVIYGAPAMLGAGAASTALALGPVIGFGTTGFVSAYDKGIPAAIKRGGIDAALGAIYPATAHLSRLYRVAIESSAAFAVSEQDEFSKRLIDGLTFGLIAGSPGKRPPYKFMKDHFGVKDPAALQHVAVQEAQIQSNSNAQSIAAMESIVTDASGKPITSLLDAFTVYREMLSGEHPMSTLPRDRDAYQLQRIKMRDKESEVDPRPIDRDVSYDRRSARFAPGPKWSEQRRHTINETTMAGIFGKKYKKTGEIVGKLAEAFGLPIHKTPARDLVRGARGSWAPEGNPAGGRRTVAPVGDVQTPAHEFGHDISFRDPTLARYHDYTAKGESKTYDTQTKRRPYQEELHADFERIDAIATEHNVGPETVMRSDGSFDKRYTGILTEDGKATVSGIFKLHKDGLIPDDIQYIPELLGFSYDRDNLPEGMAEAFRIWLTNNKMMKGGEIDFAGIAPKVSKILEDWRKALPRKQRKALDTFQREAHEYLNLQANAAARTKYGPDMDPGGVLASREQRIRQPMFDDMAGFANLEQGTYGKLLPDSIYEHMRLLRGNSETTTRMMDFGYPVLKPDYPGGVKPEPGEPILLKVEYEGVGLKVYLEKVATSDKNLDAGLHYVVMRQASELKKQVEATLGGVRRIVNIDKVALEDLPDLMAGMGLPRTHPDGSPISKSEFKTMIETRQMTREKLFSQEMIDQGLATGKNHPEYEQLFKDLKFFADKMADFGEKAGLWNSTQRKNWQRQMFVFSFMREMDSAQVGNKIQRAAMAGQTPWHVLKGDTKNLKDPLQLLLETHARTFKLSMENINKRELVDFMMKADGGGRWGTLIKPITDIKHFKWKEIEDGVFRELKKTYPNLDDTMLRTMMELELPNHASLEKLSLFMGDVKPHGENVLTYYDGGVPKYFEINDPLLMRSIQAMRRPNLVGFMKQWNNLRRFKQRWITRGPGFMFVNLWRDAAMSSIMSRTGNFHFGKSVKGLWGAIRKDKDFQDMTANGGGGAGIREDLGDIRRRLVRHSRKTNHDPRFLIVTPRDVLRAIDDIGRVMEVAARLGEFKAARKQNMSARHSAYLAREVSTDFGMRGDNAKMNFLSQTIPFFNAMMVGTDRLYRGVKMDPNFKAATAIKIGIVGINSVALYAINRQIPQYMAIDRWDKLAYWHFFTPKWSQDGEREKVKQGRFEGQLDWDHWKMPKLWEVGLIGSMSEFAAQSMLDSEDPDEVGLALGMLHMITQNVGVNLEGRSFPLPSPVGFDALIEQFSGKVLFTGNPIESQAMQNVEHWYRSRSKARAWGEYGKLFMKAPVPDIIKNPARVEALLRSFFGEFVGMGTMIVDGIFFPGGPARRPDQYPVLSRFMEGGPQVKYDKNNNLFFERATSLDQAAATRERMAKFPSDVATMKEWIDDPVKQSEIVLSKQFAHAKAMIADLNYRIELLRRGDLQGFTPKEMTIEIDRLTDLRSDLQARYNKAYVAEIRKAEKKARQQGGR